MKIIIPIKQVPETSNVKMDPDTGTMIRDGVESIINPLDLYAIELGIRLKENHGGDITAVSMGPPAAGKALKEALSMGCDSAVLISDRKFAGSDTWATSYTLAEAIRRIGDYDLIIAGERATDGDTGQVGPGIAACLGIPCVTYVSSVRGMEGSSIVAERLVEEGYQLVSAPFPCLITVVKEIGVPRLPTLRGKKRAKTTDIPVYSAGDLGLDGDRIGLKGSPTRVVKIDFPKVTRNGRLITPKDEDETAAGIEELLRFLEEKGIFQQD